MELNAVLTQRRWERRPSFDLIYRWEDIFSNGLGCPLKYRNRTLEALFRRLPGKPSLPVGGNCLLTEMEPYVGTNTYNRGNVIPYWIDFYLREEAIPALVRSYDRCPVIFVSSREAFEFLESRNTGLPLQHLPLSLPDNCLDVAGGEKDYDLVMMGRPNAVMADFFRRYTESHDCTYVYRRQEEGRFLYFDQTGACLGNMDTHEKYMALMRRCRVGIYATPGMDDAEGRTNGFSQVTPRFLEYLSAGCHVAMRYRPNADTAYFGLERFCPGIDTYDSFEAQVDAFLDRPADLSVYREYLSAHVTSARVRTLKQTLLQL